MNSIIELLACPDCRGRLRALGPAQIGCGSCVSEFGIVEGIYDLYPRKAFLTTDQVDLKGKYEEFAKSCSRGRGDDERKRITLDMVEGERILELGCAEGWMSGEIEAKAASLFACDISLNYLKRAQRRLTKAECMRLDAHSLPFQHEIFDCVVCTEILEHLLSPFKALDEIYRVTKPGGILVASVPNNMTFRRIKEHLAKNFKQFGRYPKSAHINFYDTRSLVELLKVAGFGVLRLEAAGGLVPFSGKSRAGAVAGSLFKNFGERIVVKARKGERGFWDYLLEHFKS